PRKRLRMHLHVVGLAHTETTKDYITCPFTQNLIKFCKMMKAQGHRVTVYAGEANEAPCDEHVTVVSREEQLKWFGPADPNKLIPHIWEATEPWWEIMNGRAALAISRRGKPGDILCLIGGQSQRKLSEALPKMKTVEYSVGYE